MFADDLDQAVYEWGTFVEGRIDKKVNEYLDDIRRKNAERARGGSSASMEKPSKSRLQEIRDEMIQYHINDTVREYTTVRTGGGRVSQDQGGEVAQRPGAVRVYLEKPATGDPLVDSNMSVGDVKVIRVDGASA